jgi:hypothetical protein
MRGTFRNFRSTKLLHSPTRLLTISITKKSALIMASTAQGEAGPSSIPLYLINGVATIWDAQSMSTTLSLLSRTESPRGWKRTRWIVGDKLIIAAATLHCQHDISGLRVGTLPGVSQQNGFLGLPMTLMQEETAHLVRSGTSPCSSSNFSHSCSSFLFRSNLGRVPDAD